MGPTATEIEEDRSGVYAVGSDAESKDEPESTEEARAKIEQTRAAMTDTIDALKSKLAPENLIAEAKTGAKEAAKSAVEGAVEATKEAAAPLVEATKDAAANVMAAASHLGEQASATAANIGAAVKQAVSDTGDNMKHATENIKENVRHAAETTVTTAKDAGYRVSDVVRNNPVPVALVGGTLIFLYLNSKRDRTPSYPSYNNDDRDRYTPSTGSAGYNPSAYRADSDYPAGSSYTGDSGYRTPSSTLTGATSEESRLNQAREKMGEIAGSVKHKVSDTASMVGEKVTDVKNDLGEQAHRQVERAKTLLDEKPLLVGAALLALGAAIGLLIPPTEQENRWMGQHRDRLVDQANEKAGDLAHKAGIVAQKTLDSINENAREVLTATKESARDAFDTVKSVANDAVQEVKSDASRSASWDSSNEFPGSTPSGISSGTSGSISSSSTSMSDDFSSDIQPVGTSSTGTSPKGTSSGSKPSV